MLDETLSVKAKGKKVVQSRRHSHSGSANTTAEMHQDQATTPLELLVIRHNNGGRMEHQKRQRNCMRPGTNKRHLAPQSPLRETLREREHFNLKHF